MKHRLTEYEQRVIGSLLEKEITTPEQYPLSLNALTSACNQKSNRDPVLQLDEVTVQQVLDELQKNHLVAEKSGFGSRVPKYQHRFCNTQFGALHLSDGEVAVVCELLLRGPATPGELRTHAQRLHRFADVTEVERVLEQLAEREDGPFVVRLPREPGKRESRYAHLFGEAPPAAAAEPAPASEPRPAPPPAEPDRIARLEARVASLEAQLADLFEQLGVDGTPGA